MTLLLQSFPARAKVWSEVFAAAGEPLFTQAPSGAEAKDVTALACWQPPSDLTVYQNLKLVLSVGAGVDQMPALPQHIMLCRSAAPGIETQVRDWVTMACLMMHRDMPAYLQQARTGAWNSRDTRATTTRRVGVLGMGRIGRLVAQSLTALGFPVVGWSRSGRPVDGVEIYGAEALSAVLAQADILVCLLPLTQETKGILNAKTFAALPKGAHLVHAGRGAHLHMDDLRDALDSGDLTSAMLDVTNPEPLAKDHWAWAHPQVIITPHIAAQTDAYEGAHHALNVIQALKRGEIPPGLVDQTNGY
jgi:glyoxylate/hydroxypyruvate reductase A